MDISAELRKIFNLSSNDELEQKEEKFGDVGFLSFRRQAKVKFSHTVDTLYVFIKLSDTSRTDLENIQQLSNHFCRNECIFYSIMAPILNNVFSRCHIPSPLPVTFGQRFNSSGSILVMEDLSEQGYYLPKKMLSLAEAESAVEGLARVQAAYWIARTDMDYSMDAAIFGYQSPFYDQIQAPAREGKINFSQMMSKSVEFFFSNFSKYVDHEVQQKLIQNGMQKLLASMHKMINGSQEQENEESVSKPLGLVQGDFWLSNLMFKSINNRLVCKLLDWQFWYVGPFGVDLGILFISSLSHQQFVNEFDNLFSKFYSSFKELYEKGSGLPAPFSEEQARSNLPEAFVKGLFWVLVTSNVIMDKDILDASEVMKNVAFTLQHRELRS